MTIVPLLAEVNRRGITRLAHSIRQSGTREPVAGQHARQPGGWEEES